MGTRDYVADRTPVPTGTLPELFFEAVDRFGEKDAFQRIVDGAVEGVSYLETYERVREVAGGLRALGLERGDRVAILSENRVEWSQADYGCICAGIVDVPIYTTLTPPQIAYLLEDSEAKLVFTSTPDLLRKAREAAERCSRELRFVVFDPPEELDDGVLAWESFLARGREVAEAEGDEAFRKTALQARPDDLLTFIYTSGTTGEPKGVMLTHGNLYSNVKASLGALPIDHTDNTLSFLPLSHVLQRMVDYLFFAVGCTIAYARAFDTVAEDLLVVRPTKVVAVPRLYEKVYQKVMDQGGLKGRIVQWAREVGDAWAEEMLAGRRPTLVLRLVYRLAHALVFKKIHEGIGGRLVFFISGGAPLSPEINKFFYSAGVLILEGYGLTETSPVTNVNRPDDFRIGTVGPPVPGTEIRIADDGEILIRGPQVMKGYYNRPEDTAAVLTSDGWFYTGDIGEIDEDGHLRITDRKKDILVTAGGKNIAPQPIENRVKASSFVDQAVMIGDQRPFPCLLVVPAFERLEEWARGRGLAFASRSELLELSPVQELMVAETIGGLTDLAPYETPKKIGLIQEEFTIEGGILTPSQKVKRRVVRERYGPLIDRFYDPRNVDVTVFVDVRE